MIWLLEQMQEILRLHVYKWFKLAWSVTANIRRSSSFLLLVLLLFFTVDQHRWREPPWILRRCRRPEPAARLGSVHPGPKPVLDGVCGASPDPSRTVGVFSDWTASFRTWCHPFESRTVSVFACSEIFSFIWIFRNLSDIFEHLNNFGWLSL